MFSEQGNSKGFFKGVLAGELLAGFLFAPMGGKKFRKNISKKTNGLIDDTNDLIGNVRENASNIISGTKKKIERLIN